MKRVQAEYPFEDYWLYVVEHQGENRRMANLVKKNTGSTERMTISYARYLMSVKLKRLLTRFEHVDHIDNNSMNDTLDNLQILTPEENNNKEMGRTERKAKYINLVCSGCGINFNLQLRNYKSRTKSGCKRFFCTKMCYNSAR